MVKNGTEKQTENSFTQKFGFPKVTTVDKIVDKLRDSHIQFIKESPFLVMATSDSDGKCDASPKGGMPGFVKVLDEKTLLLPDIAGNKLFQSYTYIGLIFFIPGLDETLRINGRVRIVSEEELENLNMELKVFNPDENSKILQGMIIEIEESYGHCPRAFSFSSLSNNRETIRCNTFTFRLSISNASNITFKAFSGSFNSS